MSNSIHSKNQRLSLALLWIGFLSVLGLMAWSWFSGGLCYELLRPDLSSADRITRLKAFFEDCGVLAPLVYVAFVTVEVIIAPIPGLMLYAPGASCSAHGWRHFGRHRQHDWRRDFLSSGAESESAVDRSVLFLVSHGADAGATGASRSTLDFSPASEPADLNGFTFLCSRLHPDISVASNVCHRSWYGPAVLRSIVDFRQPLQPVPGPHLSPAGPGIRISGGGLIHSASAVQSPPCITEFCRHAR